MRVFKKVLMIIFALLPIVSFLLFSATNLGNASGQPFKAFGTYTTDINSSGGYNLLVEQNTILSELSNTFFNGQYYNGTREISGIIYEFYRFDPTASVIHAFMAFVHNFEIIGGFSAPCVVVLFYVLYMVFVELIMVLYEIILFIPKKCREIFGG